MLSNTMSTDFWLSRMPATTNTEVDAGGHLASRAEAQVLSLYDAEAARLDRFARACGAEASLAADAVQEAFLDYFRLLRTGVTAREPRVWLYRHVRRYVAARQHDSVREAQAAEESERMHPRLQENPERAFSFAEFSASAYRILSPGQRECLRLRVEGFRYEEIAAVMGISTGNVGAKITRGLQRIQAYFGIREP